MKLIEKLKKCIMYFSKSNREERRFREFDCKVKKLESLSLTQLQCKYIHIQKKYEYKKNLFYCMVVVIFITFISDVWKNTIDFLKELLVLRLTVNVLEPDMQKVVFLLFLIVVFFISIGLLGCILSIAKTISVLHEEILLLEYIIKKKETADETKNL